MASAWGAAFGSAWGDAWGPLAGVIHPPSPDFIPGGIPAAGKKSRLRHAARAGVLLELHCAVSASATVRIGAAAAVDAGFRADSTAGLRLSGRAELAARAEIAIAADVVDVVLEMLLLDA